MKKPICKLVGTDGNVFAIIGAVSKALRRAGPNVQDRARSFGENEMNNKDAQDSLVPSFVRASDCRRFVESQIVTHLGDLNTLYLELDEPSREAMISLMFELNFDIKRGIDTLIVRAKAYRDLAKLELEKMK